MLATISLTALAALAAVVVLALVWALGAVTHSITMTWKNGANSTAATMSQSAESETNTSIALTASQANKEVDVVFTTTTLKSIFVVATQDTKMYTNHASGSSPDDTIQLKANVPFAWQTGTGVPCPFVGSSGAVTKLFFTNDAASTGAVTVNAIIDNAP